MEDGSIKVLLTTPPGTTAERWPPLGLLYIAAALEQRRQDTVEVIDAFCENLTHGELLDEIRARRPDVVGCNCSTHTFLDAIEALRAVSEALPGTVLLLGGIHATFAARHILEEYPFVDYIVKGEADYAVVQLLDCLEEGRSPSTVDGISYFDGASYVDNPLAIIEDLDMLPFPARHLAAGADYGLVYESVRLTFGTFTTINTSRGCPFTCRYCSCAAFSQRTIRSRSAENVVDELDHLYRNGYDQCVVVDDNFTFSTKRVRDICRLIRERDIDMELFCEGRVSNATYPLLRDMKKAGFNVMYFGAESATDHVLRYYNKTITPHQTIRAVTAAKRAGMLVIASFIFGAPVETPADIHETLTFIRRLHPHGIQINILDVLPGTPIWDEMTERGVLGPGDWKTNHRVYECLPGTCSRPELEHRVDEGYASYIQSWKTPRAITDAVLLMMRNRTARRILLGNLPILLDPQVREQVVQNMQRYRREKTAVEMTPPSQ